jgi:hypothetical protein
MNRYEFKGKLPIKTKSGLVVASSYSRIVHGGRGAYIEFHDSHIDKAVLIPVAQPHYYYDEYRTLDGIKVYHQIKQVSYADYQIGYWYITPTQLQDFIVIGRYEIAAKRCSQEVMELGI